MNAQEIQRSRSLCVCPDYKTTGLPAGLIGSSTLICEDSAPAVPFLADGDCTVWIGGLNAYWAFKWARDLFSEGHMPSVFWKPESQAEFTELAVNLVRKSGNFELSVSPPFVALRFGRHDSAQDGADNSVARQLIEIRDKPVLITRNDLEALKRQEEELTNRLTTAELEIARYGMVDTEIELVCKNNRQLMRQLITQEELCRDLVRDNELLTEQLRSVVNSGGAKKNVSPEQTRQARRMSSLNRHVVVGIRRLLGFNQTRPTNQR